MANTTFQSLNQLCLTLTTFAVLGLAMSKPVDAAVMYSVTDLGTLGGNSSSADDINDNGQVVGSAITASGGNRTFVWDSTNGIRNLDPLGSDTSIANGINNKSQVVGFFGGVASSSRAFLSDSTNGLQNLGTLDGYPNSYASDINNNGQIVGYTFSDFRALLWDNGVISDINTLIDPSSGWILGSANAINNKGQIVGEGRLNGQYGVRAFLLTPISQAPGRVPEPTSTLGLLAFGALGAGSLLKRTQKKQQSASTLS